MASSYSEKLEDCGDLPRENLKSYPFVKGIVPSFHFNDPEGLQLVKEQVRI